MISFLQINLQNSGLTGNLMEQTARELWSDLLLLSEILQGSPDSPRLISSSDQSIAVTLSQIVKLAAVESSRPRLCLHNVLGSPDLQLLLETRELFERL